MSKEENARTSKNAVPSAPANPAGDINLSDADLESAAGGLVEDTLNCTSEGTVCKGTCSIATIGCC